MEPPDRHPICRLRMFLQARLHPQPPVGTLMFMSSPADPRQMPVETITVTCCIDERAHEVPDTELAVATRRRDGYYQALCGHVIAAAPMVMPDGQPCQLCAAIREHTTARRRPTRPARTFG
jgi:hypothetical protein